jgi:hypothetical protein
VSIRPTRVVDIVLVAATAAALLAWLFGHAWISLAGLGIVAVAAWTLPDARAVRWYAATISLPLPQSLIIARVSLADLFIVPAAVQMALSWPTLPTIRSTYFKPLALMVVAFGVATAVAFIELGRLTPWAIVNKDAGLALQLTAFVVMIAFMRRREDVRQLAGWFVAGVSVVNVTALAAVIAAFAGFENTVYLLGNSRLYGWMGNPSVNGGLLLAAAMVELGLLAAPPRPGDRRSLRWINVSLLGLSLALTLSRSTWLSVVAAGATLLALLLWHRRVPGRRRRHVAVAAAWTLVPLLALGNIVRVRGGVDIQSPQTVADSLRDRLIGQCLANPTLDVCKYVDLAAPIGAPPPEPTADTSLAAGPLMNARGLNDRVAIASAAWRAYTETPRRIVTGIGLGTFYATSSPLFGVPLVIHNTFVWFLVELGPLGAVAVLWIWILTARNLWRAGGAPDDLPHLAWGALAAFAGMTLFCMLNEGFYQRQLWILMALADRLVLLMDGDESRMPMTLHPHREAQL